MISKTKLWEAQLKHFPKSIALTPQEVIDWCQEFPQRHLERYRQVSFTILHSRGVFYKIEGTRSRGFRYGLKSHQYLSFYS